MDIELSQWNVSSFGELARALESGCDKTLTYLQENSWDIFDRCIDYSTTENTPIKVRWDILNVIRMISEFSKPKELYLMSFEKLVGKPSVESAELPTVLYSLQLALVRLPVSDQISVMNGLTLALNSIKYSKRSSQDVWGGNQPCMRIEDTFNDPIAAALAFARGILRRSSEWALGPEERGPSSNQQIQQSTRFLLVGFLLNLCSEMISLVSNPLLRRGYMVAVLTLVELTSVPFELIFMQAYRMRHIVYTYNKSAIKESVEKLLLKGEMQRTSSTDSSSASSATRKEEPYLDEKKQSILSKITEQTEACIPKPYRDEVLLYAGSCMGTWDCAMSDREDENKSTTVDVQAAPVRKRVQCHARMNLSSLPLDEIVPWEEVTDDSLGKILREYRAEQEDLSEQDSDDTEYHEETAHHQTRKSKKVTPNASFRSPLRFLLKHTGTERDAAIESIGSKNDYWEHMFSEGLPWTLLGVAMVAQAVAERTATLHPAKSPFAPSMSTAPQTTAATTAIATMYDSPTTAEESATRHEIAVALPSVFSAQHLWYLLSPYLLPLLRCPSLAAHEGLILASALGVVLKNVSSVMLPRISFSTSRKGMASTRIPWVPAPAAASACEPYRFNSGSTTSSGILLFIGDAVHGASTTRTIKPPPELPGALRDRENEDKTAGDYFRRVLTTLSIAPTPMTCCTSSSSATSDVGIIPSSPSSSSPSSSSSSSSSSSAAEVPIIRIVTEPLSMHDRALILGVTASQSSYVLLLTQSLINAIVNCNVDTRRRDAYATLRSLLMLVEERSRLGLLRTLVRHCPFPQVPGLLIDCIKSCCQSASKGEPWGKAAFPMEAKIGTAVTDLLQEKATVPSVELAGEASGVVWLPSVGLRRAYAAWQRALQAASVEFYLTHTRSIAQASATKPASDFAGDGMAPIPTTTSWYCPEKQFKDPSYASGDNSQSTFDNSEGAALLWAGISPFWSPLCVRWFVHSVFDRVLDFKEKQEEVFDFRQSDGDNDKSPMSTDQLLDASDEIVAAVTLLQFLALRLRGDLQYLKSVNVTVDSAAAGDTIDRCNVTCAPLQTFFGPAPPPARSTTEELRNMRTAGIDFFIDARTRMEAAAAHIREETERLQRRNYRPNVASNRRKEFDSDGEDPQRDILRLSVLINNIDHTRSIIDDIIN